MAPGTLDRACWACGVTAAALRKRSKGQGLLLALPEAGLLLLAQAAPALARLSAGPDGAPCGRPATHVLDGLCAKCWTDDIEGEFALLVQGIGFKPSPQAAEAYLRRAVDFLYHLRRPDYGLAVPKSTKSAYSYHEAATKGDATWNDERLLLKPKEEAKMLARAQCKAEVALKQSKEVAVRSHHAI
jgi:hypothetical protein